MQSAVDRDEYVTVNWDNTDQKHNFKKYNTTVVTDFDVPYDYFSIMHDSAYAFTANGKPTIIPKVNLISGWTFILKSILNELIFVKTGQNLYESNRTALRIEREGYFQGE